MMENAMEKSLWQAYMDGASDYAKGIIQGLNNAIASDGNRSMSMMEVIGLLEGSRINFIEIVEKKTNVGNQGVGGPTSDPVMEDIKAGIGLKPIRNPLTEVKISNPTFKTDRGWGEK